MKPHTKNSVIDKIHTNCVVTSDGCWQWTAATSHGYASMGYQGKIKKVCTLIYELFILEDSIPTGLCVLHKCDNRSCINPDHLYLGTKGDNIRDRTERNPISFMGRSKLSDDDISRIKYLVLSGYDKQMLANEYKVTLRTIQRVTSIERRHQTVYEAFNNNIK